VEPIEVVEAFNTAWTDHDLDAALSMTAVDCLFDATGPAPDGAVFRGHDALRAAWQPVFDDLGSTFEVEETFAAGDRVVQRWRYGWAGGHVRGVDIFVVRDGKVAVKRSYVKG
jgi:ketosteroid isomerase-like protein